MSCPWPWQVLCSAGAGLAACHALAVSSPEQQSLQAPVDHENLQQWACGLESVRKDILMI